MIGPFVLELPLPGQRELGQITLCVLQRTKIHLGMDCQTVEKSPCGKQKYSENIREVGINFLVLTTPNIG